MKWLQLGDKNTKYFQTIVNNRYRRNLVGSVKMNSQVLEDPGEIKVAAVSYFSNNFKEEMRIRPSLGGILPRNLPSEASVQIGNQFEEGEIWAALKECSNIKASGLDDFNFSFVKKG